MTYSACDYNTYNKNVFVLLSFMTLWCAPTNAALPSEHVSATGSSSSGGGGSISWRVQAVPHQNAFSLLLEQLQDLKYGWESAVSQLNRKVEALETRIARLDTSSQLRLEKLTETVNSKEIKDELAIQQFNRNQDNNYERLSHRLNNIENKLDTALNKIQTNIDNAMSRLESHQNDMETDLTDISQSVEEIKSLAIHLDDKHNVTHKSVQQHLQTIISESASRDQVNKLTGTVRDIGHMLNETNRTVATQPPNQSQNDAGGQNMGDNVGKMLQTMKYEIGRDNHRIEDKISNMYNDLWQRLMSLETTVKAVLVMGNTTRQHIQNDFRTFLQNEWQKYAEPDSQEKYLEVVMEALTKRVQDLVRNVDSNFQKLINTQNLFMDSCHRIQADESQMETRMSHILERIFNRITNKTIRIDNRLIEAMVMIKSHQSEMLRNLGQTARNVVALTVETDRSAKNFESAFLELGERNEIIAQAIQDMQMEIQAITNTSLCASKNIDQQSAKSSNNTTDNNEVIHEKKELTDLNPTKNVTVIEKLDNTENSTRANQKLNATADEIKFIDSDEEVTRILTKETDRIKPNGLLTIESNRTTTNNQLPRVVQITLVQPEQYDSINRTNKEMTKMFYPISLSNFFDAIEQHNNRSDIDGIMQNTASEFSNVNQSDVVHKTHQQTAVDENDKILNEHINENFTIDFKGKLNYNNTDKNDTINHSIEQNLNLTGDTSSTNKPSNQTSTKANTKIKHLLKYKNISDMLQHKFNLSKNQNSRNTSNYFAQNDEVNNTSDTNDNSGNQTKENRKEFKRFKLRRPTKTVENLLKLAPKLGDRSDAFPSQLAAGIKNEDARSSAENQHQSYDLFPSKPNDQFDFDNKETENDDKISRTYLNTGSIDIDDNQDKHNSDGFMTPLFATSDETTNAEPDDFFNY